MITKNSFLISTTIIVLLSSCTSDLKRIPAEDSTGAVTSSYTYTPGYNCETIDDSGTPSSVNWSALSGFKVGPSQRHFKSPAENILRPFVSDGCSVAPDGFPGDDQKKLWTDCCVKHDAAYWVGGTKQEKEYADNELKQCISEKNYPDLGKIFKLFVKEFGGPASSQNYRWGYGWNKKKSYKNLNAAEEKQIQSLYGKNKTETLSQLANVKKLTEMCDTYDVALKGFSNDEVVLFNFLNTRLKSDSRIESAKISYFNQFQTNYLLKLDHCVTPVTLTINKGSSEPQIGNTDCSLF